MTSAIENYRNMVEQPWGRMFYELIFRQLNIAEDKRLKILDFGAGFCITADHYAAFHSVTALEPNEEMQSLRVKKNDYALIGQGSEYLKELEADSFDIVFCHNVLEYTDDKEGILKELVRVLRPAGLLSIVKHNLYGRVMASAVLGDDPKAALELLSSDDAENSMFGRRDIYGNEWLEGLLRDRMIHDNTYALRIFFGLSSNNEIKYTDEWYQAMLELETKSYAIDEYKKVSFFNHLIFKKKHEA